MKILKSKLFLFIFIIFLPLFIYLLIPSHLLTPTTLPTAPTQPSTSPSNSNFIVLGFLPYWNFSKLSQPALNTPTHLAYFSLKLNSSGRLVKLIKPTEEDPSWTGYKKLSQLQFHQPLSLVFVPQNQTALSQLLLNHSAQTQAINTIISLAKTTPNLKGINLDFEPTIPITSTLRQNFVQFVQHLKLALKNNQLTSIHLSVDIYPTTANRYRLWDLTSLNQLVDYFILMTYDYHHQTNLAGPNAPLIGTGNHYPENILKNLAETTKFIPPQKILLGIPFYGWEWTTTSTQKYSPASNRVLASLQRITQLLHQHQQIKLQWDRNSLTPFIVYHQNNQIKQIYFDDIHSIQLKLQLVKEAKLAGIAIWALGYEGYAPHLWQTISSLNH